MSRLPDAITLHNAAQVIHHEHGTTFCRVPQAVRDHLNPVASVRSMWASGVELRFNMKDEPVKIQVSVGESPGTLEVYFGDYWHEGFTIGLLPTPITIITPPLIEQMAQLPRHAFDARLVRVLLPWRETTTIHSVSGDIAPMRADQRPPTRYLAYGSSITHGNAGGRPAGMYPARVAQRCGYDYFNLGCGGSAHCEPQLADYIASRDDWDVATLELGINMVSVFDEAEFRRRVNYFVETIARSNPERWVFCFDVLPNFRDLYGHPEQQKCAAFRQIVREAVQRVAFPRCRHVEALSLLTYWPELRTDLLHPAPWGADAIAMALANVIQSTMCGDQKSVEGMN